MKKFLKNQLFKIEFKLRFRTQNINGVRSFIVIQTEGFEWPIMHACMYVSNGVYLVAVEANCSLWASIIRSKDSILHNWSFSHDYNLAFPTPYVVCVNFMHKWQIFAKLFMAILFTLRVFAFNLLSRSHQRNMFILSFCVLTWGLNSGHTPNPLSQHTIY